MLSELRVEHLGIVDELSIVLGPGMTVVAVNGVGVLDTPGRFAAVGAPGESTSKHASLTVCPVSKPAPNCAPDRSRVFRLTLMKFETKVSSP